MFDGFSSFRIDANGVSFSGMIAGSGPPVLLLHGYPQTHVAWRFIAPRLAQSFTVVVPDLPGYGNSRTQTDQPRWTKRSVANALVELMGQLGHRRFSVVGHDRGARVGYRLALDHPDQVTYYASLAVMPTLDAWNALDMKYALANFHWLFLAQPFDLPERLLSADPDAFIENAFKNMAGEVSNIDADALATYKEAFRDPAVRHAICEDYRAAAAEDLHHDEVDHANGKKLQCPVLVLWPETHSGRESPLDIWYGWADDVSGKQVRGGHLLPEVSPEEVIAELVPFLSRR